MERSIVIARSVPSQATESEKPADPDVVASAAATRYMEGKYEDEVLWVIYQEDFGKWTEDDFQQLKKSTLIKLKTALRERGIWVAPGRVNCGTHLYKTAQEDDPVAWNDKEVLDREATGKYMNSESLRGLLTRLLPDKYPQGNVNVPVSELQQAPATSYNDFKPHNDDTTPIHEERRQSGRQDLEDVPLPPGKDGYAREIRILSNLYTEKMKFGGPGDNFSMKLKLFYDSCSRAGIPESEYRKAFPIMLKGVPLDHYQTERSDSFGIDKPFSQICNYMREYYEDKIYRRACMRQWNTLTLDSIRQKHTDKTVGECFMILVEKLTELRHGLDPMSLSFQGEGEMMDQIVRSCQSTIHCQAALVRPAKNLAALIRTMKISIQTYSDSHPSPGPYVTYS